MPMPPLLTLADEAAYRAHYVQALSNSTHHTRDGIRVFFRRERFDHAFFEHTRRNGPNDRFSQDRATRMSWIAPTLSEPNATWYQGWDNKRRRNDVSSSVVVAYESFVVILRFGVNRQGVVTATFITCYLADAQAYPKIQRSPLWDLNACRTNLGV